MKLVIAEKPSVAMSLAAVLGATKRKDGYLEGSGYLVSWCVGHLLELAQPEAYKEQYAKWRYEDLPILPENWKYEVPKDKKTQLALLCRLMKDKRVDSVVCATDAGREGELIFRLVYEYAGCNKPMERLWISSMEDAAIREGFDHLCPGVSIDIEKTRNTLITTERGNADMFYFLLICSIFILACSLFSITRTIRNINKQIKEKRKIRVSLSNRDIEELAYAINQKDTLHKKLQVQIKQEEDQLKQSISNISHDLRTPLTSIQGYLTLLQECEDKQEQDQYIEIIKAKTDYLTDLVQEFYDLSVVENEQFDVECEKVDINRIVTDCLIEKYYEFGEIQPIIQTEKSPVWIYGNNLICKRIIENLITNAIRYSDNYIEVSINQEGVFMIKNSTQSLDEMDINLLFSKFYTVDKSRTKGGSGLGLYIVKELLKKIDGKIGNIEYNKPILSITLFFRLFK